jgi:hypothetical protein
VPFITRDAAEPVSKSPVPDPPAAPAAPPAAAKHEEPPAPAVSKVEDDEATVITARPAAAAALVTTPAAARIAAAADAGHATAPVVPPVPSVAHADAPLPVPARADIPERVQAIPVTYHPPAPAPTPAPVPPPSRTPETAPSAVAEIANLPAAESTSEFLSETPSPELRELSFGQEKTPPSRAGRFVAAAAAVVILGGIGYAAWGWDVQSVGTTVPAPPASPAAAGPGALPAALPPMSREELEALYPVRRFVPMPPPEGPVVDTPPEAAFPSGDPATIPQVSFR